MEIWYSCMESHLEDFRKNSTPDLIESAGSNSDFHTLIQDSCIPDKTIVGHDIVACIVIEKYPFFGS